VENAENGVGEVEARLAKKRHEHNATKALLRDEAKKREDNERDLEHASTEQSCEFEKFGIGMSCAWPVISPPNDRGVFAAINW